ncbi:MAG TPA: CAP domain-containing protein, partial [Xanthobacteraceae bacterium]
MIFSLTRKTVSIAALALALAGCAAETPPAGQPSFYRSLAGPAAELDAVAAASMISGYRQNNALGGVALDPTLMRLADEQARAMAARDKLDHDTKGDFGKRMKASGFDAKIAVEN